LEDLRLENARPECFSLFKDTLTLFDHTGRYLLIRHLFKRVADADIKVTHEPQVLAWLIDLYRNFLAIDEAKIFRDELNYFYSDIMRVNYREVELCFQYFIAISLLVQFHATMDFDRSLLKMAKERVLDPIFTQVSDFRALELMKEDETSKFEHLEFLLFTLSHSMRVIDTSLGEK
jgi:hypothetical protein